MRGVRSCTDLQPQQSQVVRDRFLGCLLGGAVGDALGAPVEFMTREQIFTRFGPDGITDYAPAFGGVGRITDDTQMTLFTAEGLLRGRVRWSLKGITDYPSVTAHAYLRWLRTQGERGVVDIASGDAQPGWLIQHPELHSKRAPGKTCLSALRSMPSFGEPARNDSKGCGGVMRVAPVGLFGWAMTEAGPGAETFQLATELAQLTHGHPTGSLTAGVFASLVQSLIDGRSLSDALQTTKDFLRLEPGHEETLAAMENAERLAAEASPHNIAIAQLGQGWIAEEALAIAIYCALVARDFQHGVLLAVNHDGDSDSTGAITGNLLGASLGVGAIGERWLQPLELRAVITEVAEDLLAFPEWDSDEAAGVGDLKEGIWAKYPGW